MAQDKEIINSSATLIALMERFETANELANADLADLTAFITKTGQGRFANPDATTKLDSLLPQRPTDCQRQKITP